MRNSFHKSLYMNVIWNCWDIEKMEKDDDCANWILPYSRNSQCSKPSLRLLMVLQTRIWLCMLEPTQTGLRGGSIYTLCDKENKNLRVLFAYLGITSCHWEIPVTKNSFPWHCLESKTRLLILSPRCLQYNIVLAVIPLDSSHYIKPTRVKIHAGFYATFLTRQNNFLCDFQTLVCSATSLRICHSFPSP